MDNDQTFWCVIWGIVAFAICVFTSIIVEYNVKETRALVEMTQAGIDPVVARCGLSDTLGNSPACILYLAKAE